MATLLCALAAPLAASAAAPALDGDDLATLEERVYIVQLPEPAALNYAGRPGGVAATRPRDGERFDARASNVRAYSRELTDAHDAMLQSIGAYDRKLYSYRYTFNGFAARLTPIQAQKLRSRKDVLRVWEDAVRYLYTNDSPTFLGLFDAGSGLITNRELRGEDVVIGVIDSGITPEHPSFADTREASRPGLCRSEWAENSLLGIWLCRRFKNRDDELVYDPPADWNGSCESGDRFTADLCNNKIIGARYYPDGFLESFTLDANEFMSPRDADGHGTHIASTAAGNEVRATLAGADVDRINGIAPRARVAVYKACWLEPGQLRGSCSTSDLQRAIEDAVADGVDIINYSVGNTDISLNDPDDIALLAASDAGVLSVVAAGNDGPGAGTILSPSGAPWVLTVGASSRTGDKFAEAVRVNSPSNVAADYESREASFTPALVDEGPLTAELILADDGNAAGGTTFDACEPIVNGADMDGQVALIQRGGCDFQVKIENVEAAGAIAAVVFNNQSELIIMSGMRDSVAIPAVMIGQADGQLLQTELDNDVIVEITLDKTLLLTQADGGNAMGSFSSRGPNLTAPDILKPDVTAPGVNILAGQSPDVANGVRGENFQYLTGTSMSVPHVAGVAALIREAQPDWSPAAIKSALMTTSRQDIAKEDGTTPADPFDFGAGHIVPNDATDPGLVYEAVKQDYDAFTCGTNDPRSHGCRVPAADRQWLPDRRCGSEPGFDRGQLAGQRAHDTAPGHERRRGRAIHGQHRRAARHRRRGIAVGAVARPRRDRHLRRAPVDVECGFVRMAVRLVNLVRRDASCAQPDRGATGAVPRAARRACERTHRIVAVRRAVRLHGYVRRDRRRARCAVHRCGPDGHGRPDERVCVRSGYSQASRRASGARTPRSIVADGRHVPARRAVQRRTRTGDDDLDLYVYYCPGLVFCPSCRHRRSIRLRRAAST